jgi:predicted acyltransferase
MPEAAALTPVDGPAETPAVPERSAGSRLISLDALRAIIVALMIGMDHPLIGASTPWWLLHPEWHGFRLADFIAPAFMFIVGMSMAFSTRKLTKETHGPATRVFVRRVVVLVLLGVALGFYKYSVPLFRVGLIAPFASLRVMGVLQRIAIGSLIAWPFVRKDWRWAVGAAGVLLAVHTVLVLFVGAPGVIPGAWTATPVGAGAVATLERTSLSGWLDTAAWGIKHTYHGSGFDPDGLLGLITVGGQVLLGLALGKWAVRDDRTGRIVLPTLACGAGVALLGVLLGQIGLPINKYIWSASFVLVSSGLAAIAWAAMYWWIDLKGNSRGFQWLVPLGRNALLLFIGENAFSATLGLILIPWGGASVTLAALIARAMTKFMAPTAATLLFSVAEVAVCVWIAGVLYRKKLFFKL